MIPGDRGSHTDDSPPARQLSRVSDPRRRTQWSALHGRRLSPERLLIAYSMGIFPWYNPGDPILWHSPDRMVLLPREMTSAARLVGAPVADGTCVTTTTSPR